MTTPADELINIIKEKIRQTSHLLLELVNTSGYDDYTEEYKDTIDETVITLNKINRKL